MPTKAVRRTYSSILLAIVPLALALTATPAVAGDFVTDPVNDFDCDDQRDAIDVDRYATVGGQANAGSVTVQLSGGGQIVTLTQATPGIAGGPEADDHFGSESTAFDENGDGCDDLVIGAPDEDLVAENGSEAMDAGMIWIVPGSPDCLRPTEARSVNLHTPGISGAVGKFHRFGQALVGGDTFEGDPYLLIGAPGFRVGATGYGAGAVYYARGDETYQVTQDSSGVPGVAESTDYFGERIAATDRYIAISSPGEAIGDRSSSGMAHVFIHRLVDGHVRAISAFHQDTAGISGTAESGDRFGDGLSVVNYRAAPGDPVGALVSAGSPGEVIGSTGLNYGGMAHLVRTSNVGDLRQLASVHQDSPGVAGVVETLDGFGFETVLGTTESSAIGTPSTTNWAVASREIPEEDGGISQPQVQIFGVTANPGDNDKTVSGNDFGLPLATAGFIDSVDASRSHLYIGVPGSPSEVYGVPWPNILDGQNAAVVVYRVTG